MAQGFQRQLGPDGDVLPLAQPSQRLLVGGWWTAKRLRAAIRGSCISATSSATAGTCVHAHARTHAHMRDARTHDPCNYVTNVACTTGTPCTCTQC